MRSSLYKLTCIRDCLSKAVLDIIKMLLSVLIKKQIKNYSEGMGRQSEGVKEKKRGEPFYSSLHALVGHDALGTSY